MTTYNDKTEDQEGRQIRPILFNTAADGSGTWLVPLVDSSGQIVLGTGTSAIGKLAANTGVDIGDVDILSIAAGSNRIGKVMPDITNVRVSKAIDASIGAYTAGDMVNDDDCCDTAAVWEIAGAANAAGGYGAIWTVDWINETENQAVQYELLLFNASPTGGSLADNTANVHPHKEDRSKWIREILIPTSVARGAAVASYGSASPSSGGKLPLFYKCAAASTSLYFVVVTRTAYTQTATDDLEFIFGIEKF